MATETVLGKRSGLIEHADKCILDTFPELSATQSGCNPLEQPAFFHPLFSMPYPPVPLAHRPASLAQPQVSLVHPPGFPQSPPHEAGGPQSPPNDFGEKRRRVNAISAKPQPPLTPQTPQTPASLLSSRSGALSIPRQAPNTPSHRSPLSSSDPPFTERHNPLVRPMEGQKVTYSCGASPFVAPPQPPGMPLIMTVMNSYARLPGTLAAAPSLEYDFSRLDPPLMPGFVPVSTVVSKPPIVPALKIPRRRPVVPVKKWKPQEIVLPKVVDVGPFEDCDDSGGHYVIKSGEWFAGRYLIMKLLGQGTFGKVAQVWDERTRQYCAIKIIRAVPKYRDASKVELRVLSLLSVCDPTASMKCVRMRECFDYRNHVCIVTDLHDISVYDFLKENQFLPFPGIHIHHFAKQIIESVAFIHSMGLVHTDLKPENILLADSSSRSCAFRRKTRRSRRPVTRKELNSTDVTLIDFGSAVFEDEYHSNVVSTRHYRAPEIILGSGWSFPCDMWSIGCVLIELCTGRVLFETRNDLEHLHMMEKTLNARFTSEQLNRTARSQAATLLATRSYPSRLAPLLEQGQLDSVANMGTVSHLVYSNMGSSTETEFWNGFVDLVSRLMTLDPNARITSQEALQHPWIQG